MSYFLSSDKMYCSMAAVIEGASVVGAGMLLTRLASSMARFVEFPQPAILVLFCLKSGKLSNNDLISAGLKNAITS